MSKVFIIDPEAEAARGAAQDRSEQDRAEREATFKEDHSRPGFKAYKTKSEIEAER